MDINISSEDTRWNNVQHAVGAMYWILKDGKVDTSISDRASAPRTAVGVKPDGSVVFYTIDGRQSGLSVGATIQMAAQRLQELGCENAVLLDGGGSTTLVSTYPDFGTSSTINSPSEGTPLCFQRHLPAVQPEPHRDSRFPLRHPQKPDPSARRHHPVRGLRHGHRLVSHGHPPRRCNLVLGG